MAKAAARAKTARARRSWSREDIRLLKSAARKEPVAKIAKALKANRRRNASKGEERTHLAQHDPQEASTRKEALRQKGAGCPTRPFESRSRKVRVNEHRNGTPDLHRIGTP